MLISVNVKRKPVSLWATLYTFLFLFKLINFQHQKWCWKWKQQMLKVLLFEKSSLKIKNKFEISTGCPRFWKVRESQGKWNRSGKVRENDLFSEKSGKIMRIFHKSVIFWLFFKSILEKLGKKIFALRAIFFIYLHLF